MTSVLKAPAKGLRLALATLALLAAQQASALTLVNDPTNTVNIPGLTGFVTNGDLMDGMSVTVTFSGGFTQTLAWADTGPGAGGVTGNGWGLSLIGDSFSESWNFLINGNANLGQLVTLVLDGSTGFTVFDRTEPSFGTPGSAQGGDFITSLTDDGTVTYSNQIAIIPNGPVGDLWQLITVQFAADQGPRADWSFTQDTDNDSRITQVPEPGSLLLMSLALGALGFIKRRRNPAI